MKNKLLFVLLGVTLVVGISAFPPRSASASSGQGTEGWLTSLEEALEQAARDNSYILVDLYAEWCGWCHTLEEQVFTTPEFREFTRDFVLLRVDVDDGAEGSALQARFEAYSLPTTLLLDQNRVKVGSVAGFAPTPAFLQRLSSELASYRSFLEHYDRMKETGDKRALQQLFGQLHQRGDGERAAVVIDRVLKQTAEDSPLVAGLLFLKADSHRLAARYDLARESLAKAEALSRSSPNPDLAEQLDLLSYRIAHDSHNCDGAKKSLEHFLESHPKSSFRRDAEKALRDLRRGRGLDCA